MNYTNTITSLILIIISLIVFFIAFALGEMSELTYLYSIILLMSFLILVYCDYWEVLKSDEEIKEGVMRWIENEKKK